MVKYGYNSDRHRSRGHWDVGELRLADRKWCAGQGGLNLSAYQETVARYREALIVRGGTAVNIQPRARLYM